MIGQNSKLRKSISNVCKISHQKQRLHQKFLTFYFLMAFLSSVLLLTKWPPGVFIHCFPSDDLLFTYAHLFSSGWPDYNAVCLQTVNTFPMVSISKGATVSFHSFKMTLIQQIIIFAFNLKF